MEGEIWDARSLARLHDVPSIGMLLTWFGCWPAWMRFFLASCRENPSVQWFIISDCDEPQDLPCNVAIVRRSFEEYRADIQARLGIACHWDKPYKLCDMKPAMAYLHPDLVEGFDFWGFGDLDVIYGDIRAIYTVDVLRNDLISSHETITAGHLTLVRNADRLNASFKRIRGWKALLGRSEHRGFDEFQWSHQFSPLRGGAFDRLKQRIRSPSLSAKTLFVEQHSTALHPLPWIDGSRNYPDVWFWRDGKLTAEGAGDREFLYLHFSNWQSDRWNEGGVAAWNRIATIDHCPPGRLGSFRIGPDGFWPLTDAQVVPRSAPREATAGLTSL